MSGSDGTSAGGQVQRFGDVALRQKFITKEQLDAAIERQAEIKLPIGEVLVEMGFVTPSQVAAILKYQRALYALSEKEARGEQENKDPLIGETLGGCLITEKVGAGNMGRAYKAHHLKLDRDVCVKVLHPELMKDRRTRARFTREARSAAKLEHVGIVSVYDLDEVGPYTYIVMQLVDGKSLKEVIDERGPVGPKRAVFVGARIAEALACAHAQKIVHRDVKPANVLVSKQGAVKLTDFGLVRVVEKKADDAGVSSVGELIGTPTYMSPEQAQAIPEIDGRSDIYSLGVLIYELACGAVPFEARQLVALLRKHMLDPFPSLRVRMPGCPRELDELLQRMCKKEPSERPDAVEAARQLRALYRSAFGAEPPSDISGPPTVMLRPTPAGGVPKPGTPGFAERPTGFYGQRDVMEAAVDKLVGRALAGSFAQAVKDARRLQPAVAREALRRMLSGLAAAHREAEVAAAADEALDLAGDDPPTLLALARSHAAGGQAAKAEALLARACASAPDDADLALELAQVRAGLGRRDAAIEVLAALLVRKPRDLALLRRAAELRWIVLGDQAGAAAWYGHAADLDRSAFEPRLQQGNLLLEAGDAEPAAKALEDAVARQPSSAIAHELLGKARKLKGDTSGAAAAFQRALDLDPRAASARLLLIEDARAARRWHDVSRFATEGLGLTPQDRDLQFELARAREAVGDDEAALRLFQGIVAKQPGHESAKAAIARLQQRKR